MMRPRTLADELRDGVEALALHVSEIQQSQLLDYLALLHADSPARLDALLDEIGAFEGVLKTTTSVVLARRIDRT